MKRLALLTDLHADVHALRDALDQFAKLNVDEVVCAGDLVDYGLFPEETLALLRERNIPCIRGDHDRWAVAKGSTFQTQWNLSEEAMRFLADLPLSLSLTLDGVKICVWHARPHSGMNGIYPDIPDSEIATFLHQSDADVLVVGHTHLAFERRTATRLLCNPGALLRAPAVPMDRPTLGTFGILELPALKFEVRLASTGEIVPHRTTQDEGARRSPSGLYLPTDVR